MSDPGKPSEPIAPATPDAPDNPARRRLLGGMAIADAAVARGGSASRDVPAARGTA